MVRTIGCSLFFVGLLAFFLLFVNWLVLPLLPASVNTGLLAFISALLIVLPMWSNFKDVVEFVQWFDRDRDRRILRKKLTRGSFDEATIDQSTRHYIRPTCTNVDPSQKEEPRFALEAPHEALFPKVDFFLSDAYANRHLFILADSGTGKTSFVLNYYAYNDRRFGRQRHKLAVVSLAVKDADRFINEIPDPEDTAIFLDALDEDVRAIKDHRTRIDELMRLCGRFRRVIVTCRTQFFPRDEEIPNRTGVIRTGPRRAGEPSEYEFSKLYIEPFDDNDVRNYINKRYHFWQVKSRRLALSIALKIDLLSVRPMLLAYIPDVIASNKEIQYIYQLYEIMIDAWLERESSWADKNDLRAFSEKLAVDIYANRETRRMERIPPNDLSILATKWSIQLEQWQITTRSLLNRDAEGNYKFAHRSIMEYLFVARLLNGDQDCFDVVLTDQMKRYLIEMLSDIAPEIELISDFLMRVELIAYPLTKEQPIHPSLWINFQAKQTSRNVFFGVNIGSIELEVITYLISASAGEIIILSKQEFEDGPRTFLMKGNQVFEFKLAKIILESGKVEYELGLFGRSDPKLVRVQEIDSLEELPSGTYIIKIHSRGEYTGELLPTIVNAREFWYEVGMYPQGLNNMIWNFINHFGVEMLPEVLRFNNSDSAQLELVSPTSNQLRLRFRPRLN